MFGYQSSNIMATWQMKPSSPSHAKGENNEAGIDLHQHNLTPRMNPGLIFNIVTLCTDSRIVLINLDTVFDKSQP